MSQYEQILSVLNEHSKMLQSISERIGLIEVHIEQIKIHGTLDNLDIVEKLKG